MEDVKGDGMYQAVIEAFNEYIIPVVVILVFMFLGYLIHILINTRLMAYARKTQTQVDDILIKCTKGPIVFIFLLVGVVLALKMMSLPSYITGYIDAVFFAAMVLAVSYAVAKFLRSLIIHYSRGKEGMKSVVPILQRLMQFTVYIIAFMLILDHFNVSITPLITTLGIAGIAVAFALQDTLSNFFAGVYIMADRPIRIGDFIKLESGEEGTVVDIGWRSARIQVFENYTVVIPNSRLANSVLINYYIPSKGTNLFIPVSVSYDSDLEHVERVLLEIGEEYIKREDACQKDYKPFVRFREFGDSGITVDLAIRLTEYTEKWRVQHEVIKEIHKRFAEEGIEIPYPQRVVWMRSEGQ